MCPSVPASARSSAPTTAGPPAHCNEVHLVGRLAAVPEERELPSGDLLVALRLVVERGPRERRPPTVDTVECTVWTLALRRRVLAWAVGDVVEVSGRLRRRFWRSAAGPVSRYDVEVQQARRVPGSTRELRSAPTRR
jgi:single-strand DNA-binding protein